MDRQQTTLRLPEEVADYIKNKAAAIGLPANSFIAVLIDLGLRLYESDVIQRVEPPDR